MAGYTACSDDQTMLSVIAPVAQATGTVRTTFFNMGLNQRCQFIVEVGNTGGSATVDATVYQATDTNGTGAKVLSPSKTITQITATGKNAVINLNATELDVNNSFNCAALLITVGTASALLSSQTLAQPEVTPPAAVVGTQVIA